MTIDLFNASFHNQTHVFFCLLFKTNSLFFISQSLAPDQSILNNSLFLKVIRTFHLIETCFYLSKTLVFPDLLQSYAYKTIFLPYHNFSKNSYLLKLSFKVSIFSFNLIVFLRSSYKSVVLQGYYHEYLSLTGKTQISFQCRQGSDFKSLIRLQKTLPRLFTFMHFT